MSKNKYSKSFEIALSAISCAIAVAFLWLGILSEFLTALGYLVGVLAIMLPLSKNFYRGAFLAYVGTCILTFILGAVVKFWDLAPFIMFFGLHPIVNALQLKHNVNTWLAYGIKAIWFVGTLFAGYFMMVYGFIGSALLQTDLYKAISGYIYVIIPIFGAVFLLVYDYLIFRCQGMVNSLVARIKK